MVLCILEWSLFWVFSNFSKGLIWFEINKKKYPPSFKSLSQSLRVPPAMLVYQLNNMGFLAIKYQFFIPAIAMVQKF